MPGESPLGMMHPARMPKRRGSAADKPRRRAWLILLPPLIVAALALGWCWLWSYAASVANRTLSQWMAAEAVAGRSYSCASQQTSGFPFSIDLRCRQAAAEIKSNEPPFAVTAKAVTFAAKLYRPTSLNGDVTGPLTLAELGQPPRFVANWANARISVQGVPPMPERASLTLDHPRVEGAGANDQVFFQADNAQFDGRIVQGSPASNPVIEAVLTFSAAVAPTLHPILADRLNGDIDAVLQGFKDLSPKPWSARFREMQAAGGAIEIKALRIERTDVTIVGTGTLKVNEHGRLDGLIRVAISGLDTLIPLLGIDKMIGQGIDRLTGDQSGSPGGLGTLDRLLPGLSGVVRDSANAGVIDNLKKMGEPTKIDNKPAVMLPLRVADGDVYLGMVPLGQLPALF
ncbi:MAG TPA: DUF2125 domain-containing protein [Xanthobacteraceae bacterium]